MILKPLSMLRRASEVQPIELIASFYSAMDTAGTSVAFPEGVQSGDLIIGCAARYNTPVPAMPSGWTSIASQPSTGTEPAARAAWLRVSNQTETGTWTAANKFVGIVLRHCHATSPIGVVASRWDGDDDKIYYDAVETGAESSWVVAFGVHHGHDIANVQSPNADLTLDLYQPTTGTRQDIIILLHSNGPTAGHAGGSYVVRTGTTDNGLTIQCEVKNG